MRTGERVERSGLKESASADWIVSGRGGSWEKTTVSISVLSGMGKPREEKGRRSIEKQRL